VGNAPDGFSRGCVGHSHTSAGHRAGALRVRVRVLRALLPGTHTEGASSYHPAAFQCAMDSPCHPHLSGHALEHGGASAAAIDATQALADAFLQLPVASQHVPSLHNLFSWLPGTLLLPDSTLLGARIPSQDAVYSQESLEWQSGGYHSQLLFACIPPATFLCCH